MRFIAGALFGLLLFSLGVEVMQLYRVKKVEKVPPYIWISPAPLANGRLDTICDTTRLEMPYCLTRDHHLVRHFREQDHARTKLDQPREQ